MCGSFIKLSLFNFSFDFFLNSIYNDMKNKKWYDNDPLFGMGDLYTKNYERNFQNL